MADALCGPSNALQNFSKHTSVDRTLQQDRTFVKRRAEQGFRSTGPAAGALDAEFHAFQAPQVPSIPLQRAQLPLAHVARYATPPQQGLSDWASDFQKLNVSGSRSSTPIIAQQRGQNPGGWHAEFMAGQTPAQHQAPMQPLIQSQFQAPFQSYNPYMNDTLYTSAMQPMQIDQTLHDEPQFDDAAFAEAFDHAKAEIEQASSLKGKDKASTTEEFSMSFACTDPGDVMGEYEFDAAQLGPTSETMRPDIYSSVRSVEQATDQELEFQPDELPRIGADTILAKNESEAINPQIEADELSRTAGHLLDTLKDEKNTKFQQSSFLALMRQLRDKEIKVDGDKMVPVNQISEQPPHPGGRYYPYDAFSRPPLNIGPTVDSSDGPPIQHYYAEP